MSFHILIMAGGKGKRMKSKKVKVLHTIMGKPMVKWVIQTAKEIKPESIILVYGNKGKEIKQLFSDIEYAHQREPLGTADAVSCGLKKIKGNSGNLVVLSADVPLISKRTLENLLKYHRKKNFRATIITFEAVNPYGYGRIIREGDRIMRIVEEKDATIKQKKIKEVNGGVYCFSIPELKKALKLISTDNSQGEYYLTDVITLIQKNGGKVGGIKINDRVELLGVNTREDLSEIVNIIRKRKIRKLQRNGVTILMPDTVYIEPEVKIGRDTIIYPNVIIRGNTKIGSDCEIGPFIELKNAKIPQGSTIK